MERPLFAIGEGHDTHRLVPGRPLILGGLPIEHHRGLDGHSDADVLLHAITDALLGAAGMGDIGEWFPNTDTAFAGADSAELLRTVVAEVRARGWAVGNLDCTVLAERPKLSPHKPAIRSRIAELLGIGAGQCNVKAKTGEAVGPVGREEAISASAVVLLFRTDN